MRIRPCPGSPRANGLRTSQPRATKSTTPCYSTLSAARCTARSSATNADSLAKASLTMRPCALMLSMISLGVRWSRRCRHPLPDRRLSWQSPRGAARPFQRFPFNFAYGFPWPDLVDPLGFERADDASGQLSIHCPAMHVYMHERDRRRRRFRPKDRSRAAPPSHMLRMCCRAMGSGLTPNRERGLGKIC